MMRVLFSNPPWWVSESEALLPDGQRPRLWTAGVRAGSRWPHTAMVGRRPDHFAFGDYLPFPFFMAYAASYAAQHTEAEVVCRDSIALAESYRAYFDFLDANPFDLIFIESATPSWEHDSQLIGILAQRHPRMRIVVTGPITATGAQLLEHHPIHACIRGEYEKGAVKVIEGATGLLDFDLLTREEMNRAPFPMMDPLTARRYWDCNPIGQQAPHAQVWSSRGCPYKCIFCVWPATMTGNDPDGTGKRTVRHYSAEYMEAYLSELMARFKYRSIYFDDDTFNLGDAHVERMCAVMAKLALPWSAMCRADTIRLDTWRLMKDSGCFGVKIGFESGNQQVVDEIVNKRLDLEQARAVVHECKRLGLTVHGTFTYGLPGETDAQRADTKAYIASAPFDSIQESGTAEIEGTPLHTLRLAGKLDRYQGAHADGDYLVESDGSRKMSRMAARPHDDKVRRVIYCDSALRDNRGHFANACRRLGGELASREIPVRVFASRHIDPGLAAELGARPHFALPPYASVSHDPLSGWLENFFAVSAAVGEGLAAIDDVGPDDLVYWNSACPAELAGLIDWMQARFTPATCPMVAVEFGGPPGVRRERRPDGSGSFTLTNQDPTLYRFARRRLGPEFQQRLRLYTFDPTSSEDYAQVLDLPVAVLPLPQRPARAPRSRAGKRPVTVAVLGHQRPDKGFQLLPALAPLVLAGDAACRLLVHNGAPREMAAETVLLRELARTEPRLTVDTRPADGALWQELLDRTDLIVLPYEPERYLNAYSAIAAEALADGIPFVAPAGTTMARLLHDYGGPGAVFADWTAPSVADAVARALADFDRLASGARAAAELWGRHNGPERTVDALLLASAG